MKPCLHFFFFYPTEIALCQIQAVSGTSCYFSTIFSSIYQTQEDIAFLIKVKKRRTGNCLWKKCHALTGPFANPMWGVPPQSVKQPCLLKGVLTGDLKAFCGSWQVSMHAYPFDFTSFPSERVCCVCMHTCR